MDNERQSNPIQIVFLLFFGFAIGALTVFFWSAPEALEDPTIHVLKEEIGWRAFKEKKLEERHKKDSTENIALAKDVVTKEQRAKQAEARYAQVRKAVPLTHKDTIVFLMRDTIACDSALLRAKELNTGLTKQIVKDNSIIQELDTLNSDLRLDKKQLMQVDSLHTKKEKSLVKEGNKKFWKGLLEGLGIGGGLGALLMLLLL